MKKIIETHFHTYSSILRTQNNFLVKMYVYFQTINEKGCNLSIESGKRNLVFLVIILR